MQSNADLVRRGYEAFNSGDVETLTEIIRDDAVLYQPGSTDVSGEYRGREAVLGFFGKLAGRSGGTFRAEMDELYASDRNAVVVHHATAQNGSRALDTQTVLVFTLEDGLVTRFDIVQKDQQAWDAFFA